MIRFRKPLPVLARLRLTRFDALALSVAVVFATATGLLAFVSAPEPHGLRVAFMQNSAGGVPNIWIADPANPQDAEQLTFTQFGVYDFSPSPDGRTIAYTDRDFKSGSAEIMLLDLQTGTTRQLTDCVAQDADCTSTPVWRPDGQMIAYERRDLNTGLGLGISAPRIWLLDLSTSPPTTSPLFDDPQVVGYTPVWSADGSRLAFYDNANQGILVYNFNASETEGEPAIAFVPSSYGTPGVFSPDGRQLVFAEILPTGPLVHSYLQIADLDSNLLELLTTPDDYADDQSAAWNPDGRHLAIARRFLDSNRITRGHQIHLVDLQADTITPLVYDPRYNHGFFSWSPDGRQLLIQRFPMLTPEGEVNYEATTEVWTYNLDTQALTLVAQNAFQPRWVPAG